MPKRPNHRRRRKHQSRSQIRVKRNVPFPDTYKTNMNYSENIVRTPATYVDNYVFRLNSVYDPNYTGVGHQPLGHDQLAALYNRYRVDAVLVDFEFTNLTTMPVIIGLVAQNTLSNASGVDTLRESPWSMVKTLGSFSGSNSTIRLRRWISLAALNGVTRAQYKSDDSTNSVIGSNPNEVLGLALYAYAADGSTTIQYSMNAKLVMNTTWYDRIPLTQS